jgi:hypothetical protein
LTAGSGLIYRTSGRATAAEAKLVNSAMAIAVLILANMIRPLYLSVVHEAGLPYREPTHAE